MFQKKQIKILKQRIESIESMLGIVYNSDWEYHVKTDNSLLSRIDKISKKEKPVPLEELD